MPNLNIKLRIVLVLGALAATARNLFVSVVYQPTIDTITKIHDQQKNFNNVGTRNKDGNSIMESETNGFGNAPNGVVLVVQQNKVGGKESQKLQQKHDSIGDAKVEEPFTNLQEINIDSQMNMLNLRENKGKVQVKEGVDEVPNSTKKPYFLVATALFKNEGDILKEWVDHHLWQGVDHFYLINNNSTDNFMEVLTPYINDGIVTLYNDTRRHAQAKLNQKYFTPTVKEQAEWVLSIDLDEFVYAMVPQSTSQEYSSLLSKSKKKVLTIADVLQNHPAVTDEVGAIYLSWTYYGSSGLIEQPASVRDNFVKCKPTVSYAGGKYIVRASSLRQMHIHDPFLLKGTGVSKLNNCMKPRGDSGAMRGKSPENCGDIRSDPFVLGINHYNIMSWERFERVKMGRGSAAGAENDNAKDANYFRGYDKGRTEDCYHLANLMNA